LKNIILRKNTRNKQK